MIGVDESGRDDGDRGRDGVEEETIFPELIHLLFTSSYISLFLDFLFPFSLFFLFFLLFFYFLKDTSKFQNNLHEIRIWRSFCL